MTIRFAQVVAVHPQRRTVDLCFLDDGLRYADARVLSASASSDAGSWDVPDVPRPPSEGQAGGIGTPGRAMVAACGFVEGRPVVMGWVHNSGGQVLPNEQNRRVDRHASGVVSTIGPDGSVQLQHPGGVGVRIGAGDALDDLAHKMASAWNVPASSPPTITVEAANYKLTIAPGGQVSLYAKGNVTVDSTGDVSLNAGGNTYLTADGAVNLGAAGGKKVVVDGDPCSNGGHVIATQTRVKAA